MYVNDEEGGVLRSASSFLSSPFSPSSSSVSLLSSVKERSTAMLRAAKEKMKLVSVTHTDTTMSSFLDDSSSLHNSNNNSQVMFGSPLGSPDTLPGSINIVNNDHVTVSEATVMDMEDILARKRALADIQE
uniref:RWD domain-containing protein 3 n=1 Tax=Lygus hesperus TaxID=30085 RepID=A0A0A9XTG0_LYGHE